MSDTPAWDAAASGHCAGEPLGSTGGGLSVPRAAPLLPGSRERMQPELQAWANLFLPNLFLESKAHHLLPFEPQGR